MEKVYLVPREGAKLRDPITGRELPAEGGFMPHSTFWRRRVVDGAVVIGEPSKADKAESKAPEAKADEKAPAAAQEKKNSKAQKVENNGGKQ